MEWLVIPWWLFSLEKLFGIFVRGISPKEADIAVTCEEIEDASVEADYDKVVDVDLEEDSKTLKDKVEPVKGVNSEDPLKIES